MCDSVNTASLQQLEEENFEQKCLCVLVLDTSGSMNTSGAINELNKGLQTFKDLTMQDDVTRDRLELAIVTFNSKATVIQQPDLLANVTMPTLTASGQTQLVSAIEEAQKIVEDRKSYWKSKGIPYYRPWIVVMTDGDPYPIKDYNGNVIQDIDAIASKVQQDADNKKYVFFMIGIGNDVQDDTLTTLATTQCPAVRMADVRFDEFFSWLSASAVAVVTPPTDIPDNPQPVPTPPINDWGGFVIGTSV